MLPSFYCLLATLPLLAGADPVTLVDLDEQMLREAHMSSSNGAAGLQTALV